jgi:hypothetical protein
MLAPHARPQALPIKRESSEMMKRTRHLSAAVVAIGLLGLVALLVRSFHSGQLPETRSVAANVVFNEPGHYRSPSGTRSVEIWADPDGLLRHRVEGHDFSTMGAGFSPESAWMMCWDENSQLWSYNPDAYPQYCTVYCVDSSEGHGVRVCGEAGGWQGIPETFLNELPAEAQATYHQAQTHQANLTK